MATVHSAELNKWLSALTDGTRTWLGGMRSGPGARDNSQWIWVDETPVDYSNWGGPQPDNAGGAEYCLEFIHGGAGKWNDARCTGKQSLTGHICEVHSESKIHFFLTQLLLLNEDYT